MKTNTAFDRTSFNVLPGLSVVPEYLRSLYEICALAVYDREFPILRNAFAQQLGFCTGMPGDVCLGLECVFMHNPELNVGFWAPYAPDAFHVRCPGNGYENRAMDRATLGAAVTLLTVNHYGWHLAENAEPDTEQYRLAEAMSDHYLALRDWVFDLSERGLLDGEAIAGVID